MFQKIRLLLRYTIAWIIVIGCVALIGFVLYPLLSEKYTSMALPGNERYTGGYSIKRWYPLEIARNKEIISGEVDKSTKSTTKLDSLEEIATETVGKKTNNFFKAFKDAFSTNTNKKTVTYLKDTVGVYRGQ